MAIRSSILAQEIWTVEPYGLQPMGSEKSRKDFANKQRVAFFNLLTFSLVTCAYLFK